MRTWRNPIAAQFQAECIAFYGEHPGCRECAQDARINAIRRLADKYPCERLLRHMRRIHAIWRGIERDIKCRIATWHMADE